MPTVIGPESFVFRLRRTAGLCRRFSGRQLSHLFRLRRTGGGLGPVPGAPHGHRRGGGRRGGGRLPHLGVSPLLWARPMEPGWAGGGGLPHGPALDSRRPIRLRRMSAWRRCITTRCCRRGVRLRRMGAVADGPATGLCPAHPLPAVHQQQAGWAGGCSLAPDPRQASVRLRRSRAGARRP